MFVSIRGTQKKKKKKKAEKLMPNKNMSQKQKMSTRFECRNEYKK